MTTMTEPQLPVLLTAFETASILRVHVESLYRWRREGLIQGVTLGGSVRFSSDEVARIVAEGCGVDRTRKPQPAEAAVAGA